SASSCSPGAFDRAFCARRIAVVTWQRVGSGTSRFHSASGAWQTARGHPHSGHSSSERHFARAVIQPCSTSSHSTSGREETRRPASSYSSTVVGSQPLNRL